jgi:hypothetical protein
MTLLKSFLFLGLAGCCLAQVPQTVSFEANAVLTGTTSYAFSGTGTITGLGTATLSGAGVLDPSLLTSQPVGVIPGSFTMIFSDGALLSGTFEVPTGVLVPQLGGPTAAGSIKFTGGTGRFEGARGVFSPLTGMGTITSVNTASFILSGNGTLTSRDYILPQFVYGGGWYTALYFYNANPTTKGYVINYFANDGTPLNVPGQGTSTPVTIGANGSVRIEAPNVGTLVQGYATVTLPEGVSGYGVFRQSVQGIADQEAVVPLVNAASTQSILTFDDTNYITAAAVVNTGAVGALVTVTVTGINGSPLGTATISLGAHSKTAVALRSLDGLTNIAGNRGTATFTVSSGTLAVLGLRFYGSAFTSIPTTDK